MKITINNLKNTLTAREVLSAKHLFAIKGGDGEDIRNRCCCPPPTPPKPTASVCADTTNTSGSSSGSSSDSSTSSSTKG
jgi:hypothetical protein